MTPAQTRTLWSRVTIAGIAMIVIGLYLTLGFARGTLCSGLFLAGLGMWLVSVCDQGGKK